MKAAIYVRVSKQDQDFERQISDLKAVADSRQWTVTETITEKISGSKTNRKGIEHLLEIAGSGTINKVLVSEVSRLGRNTLDVLTTVNKLNELGVSVYIHSYQIETLLSNGKVNSMASFMLTILAEFATMEKATLIDRINSGLKQAKKNGKTLGRPEGTTKSNEQLIEEYKPVVKLLKQGLSIRKVAKLSDVAVNTVLKVKQAL